VPGMYCDGEHTRATRPREGDGPNQMPSLADKQKQKSKGHRGGESVQPAPWSAFVAHPTFESEAASICAARICGTDSTVDVHLAHRARTPQIDGNRWE